MTVDDTHKTQTAETPRFTERYIGESYYQPFQGLTQEDRLDLTIDVLTETARELDEHDKSMPEVGFILEEEEETLIFGHHVIPLDGVGEVYHSWIQDTDTRTSCERFHDRLEEILQNALRHLVGSAEKSPEISLTWDVDTWMGATEDDWYRPVDTADDLRTLSACEERGTIAEGVTAWAVTRSWWLNVETAIAGKAWPNTGQYLGLNGQCVYVAPATDEAGYDTDGWDVSWGEASAWEDRSYEWIQTTEEMHAKVESFILAATEKD